MVSSIPTNNLQVLLHQVREDLEVMAMRRYSTLLRILEQEPHHQIQFCVISRTLYSGRGSLILFCEGGTWYILTPVDMVIKCNQLVQRINGMKTDNRIKIFFNYKIVIMI